MATLTVMCVIAMSTVFTACGSDDDDNNNPVDNTTPVAAVMDYSLTVGDDMFNYLDLTVEYYDADGKVQTEQMTGKTWNKNVKAKLPATLGARLKMQVKSNVNPATLEKFTESYKYTYSIYPVNVSSKQLEGGKAGGSSATLDMPGNKLSDWVERHATGLAKFLYVFDANGQVTEGSWQRCICGALEQSP